MKLLLASNNAKKRAELARILADASIGVAEIVVPRDLGLTLEPVEDGVTFAENARKKALAFAAVTDLPVLADDSGLCVDALDGRPGVRSARYAGEAATDADNRARLLADLAEIAADDRGAHFACAICLARGGEVLFEAEGRCEGRILGEERGDGGFGYDPLFLHPASGRTFAELDAPTKDAISHRGAALARLKNHLVGRPASLGEG